MVAQHKLTPADQLRPILEFADVYDSASLEHAFTTAGTYNTYSHTFVRGILEQEGTTALPAGSAFNFCRVAGSLDRGVPSIIVSAHRHWRSSHEQHRCRSGAFAQTTQAGTAAAHTARAADAGARSAT